MEYVKCWCCEYYWPYDDSGKDICLLKNTYISAFDTVCEDFLLNSGLYTNRTIPYYCVNYSDKKTETAEAVSEKHN